MSECRIYLLDESAVGHMVAEESGYGECANELDSYRGGRLSE